MSEKSNIIRVEKSGNYVVMNRAALQDKELSWKAKGLMAYMLSMPDDWTFYMDELMKHSTDGKASFRSGFKELTDRGYVKRYPVRKGNRITHWETVVYENPLLTDFQEVENQEVENEEVGKQELGNQPLLSTELELSTEEELSTDNTNSFRGLFDHYLSKKIINHQKITSAMRTAANARLRDYSYDQLIQAIDNYAIVYHGDQYWFNTKYGFADLMRDKDVRKFINDADPLTNFSRNRGRGEFNARNRTSPTRNDAIQSNIETAHERRRRIAGIESSGNTD